MSRMNREGVYGKSEGAFKSSKSPYRGYFNFYDARDYHCWWDIETLPKLYYERSKRLCDEIFRVAEKWVSPPFSVDGWRLDVADELPMDFLRKLRKSVIRNIDFSHFKFLRI